MKRKYLSKCYVYFNTDNTDFYTQMHGHEPDKVQEWGDLMFFSIGS